jgi:vitamin B12 transporter
VSEDLFDLTEQTNDDCSEEELISPAGLTGLPLDERLILGLNVRLSHDAQDLESTELDDYELVDFNASYLLGHGLEIYGRVENVLDEDYEEFPTYNTSGRAGYAGLRFSF